MRELILLRHAHADGPAAGQDDLQRPLSATGVQEAHDAGAWLREQGLRPDRVLCSPAARTRQTLAALGDIGAGEVREEAAIYEASVGELIALADGGETRQASVLSGLEQLAALLYSGQSGDYRGMPPAGIAVLHLPADAAIEPADVAFTGHDLRLLPRAFDHARRGRHIINQNIILSLLIISALLPLALFGILGLAAVVLVHEIAEVLVILNGLRAARGKR